MMAEAVADDFKTKIMSKKTFSFLILLLLPLIGYSQQTLKYDVTIAGISIGEMTAVKKKDGDKTLYEIKSLVSFWFFGKITLDFNTKAHYQGRQFINSEVNSKTNRGDFTTKINWEKDHYDIKARNYKYEMDTVVRRPMYYTSATFFFEEPTSVKEMIPEAYGLPIPITKAKDYYEVTVNGNKNRYYYTNGVMTRAVMEFPIKNYVLKLKE
jgi:hypothetical protein